MKRVIRDKLTATLRTIEDFRCSHGRYYDKCPHGCRMAPPKPDAPVRTQEPECHRCGGSLRGRYGYISTHCPNPECEAYADNRPDPPKYEVWMNRMPGEEA
jgi:hypothetical protein